MAKGELKSLLASKLEKYGVEVYEEVRHEQNEVGGDAGLAESFNGEGRAGGVKKD